MLGNFPRRPRRLRLRAILPAPGARGRGSGRPPEYLPQPLERVKRVPAAGMVSIAPPLRTYILLRAVHLRRPGRRRRGILS